MSYRFDPDEPLTNEQITAVLREMLSKIEDETVAEAERKEEFPTIRIFLKHSTQ